jgi:hypothetical protein
MNFLCEAVSSGRLVQRHRRAVAALVLPGLLFAASASPVEQATLLDQLRTDYAAMVSAEQEYRRLRKRGALNEQEAADYAAYVARLYRLVAEDCRSVMAAGLDMPDGVVCPELAAMPVPADIDLAAERTRDEMTGELDAALLAGLGEFDEMLLREQERVKASAPLTDVADGDAGGGIAGGGVAGGDAAGEGVAGAAGTTGNGTQAGDAGEGTRTSGGGSGSSVGGGATPPGSWNQAGRSPSQPDDIPDGSDDDVVARQLREAAEKETDPELKEKLWEEYRKYKQGTR